MGMYTNYTINRQDFKIPENTDCFQIKDLLRYGECESKWYEHENDMMVLSDYNEGIKFVLSGISECFGYEVSIEGFERNMFEKTFLNGKMISHKIAKIVMTETINEVK